MLIFGPGLTDCYACELKLNNSLYVQYVSEDHRASLIVECIRNPLNTVEGVEEMMEEELAYAAADECLDANKGPKTQTTRG